MSHYFVTDEARGNLIALVRRHAHRMGNLLMGVIGNGELLSEELPPHSQAAQWLKDMRACAEKAAQLNRDLQKELDNYVQGALSISTVRNDEVLAQIERNKVRRRVLIVDDRALVRSLAKTVLEREGYEVLLAENREETWAVCRAERGSLACVLLDFNIPGGSGYELVDAVIKAAPKVPVVVMSGHSRREVEQLLSGLAIAGVLEKPFFKEDLVLVVRSCIEKAAKIEAPHDACSSLGESTGSALLTP